MSQFKLTVITQEEHVLSEMIDQVTAPASEGEVTIMTGHVPLFTRLLDGILSIKQGDSVQELAILGGFMDVGPNNEVTIMSDAAFRTDSINEAKAEAARKQAEMTMKQKISEADFKLAEQDLRRAVLELKAARSKRNRQGRA